MLMLGSGTPADRELLRSVDGLIAEALSELRSSCLPAGPLDLPPPRANSSAAQPFHSVPPIRPPVTSPPRLVPAQLLPLQARRLSNEPPPNAQTRTIERPLSAEPRHYGTTRAQVGATTSQYRESTAQDRINGRSTGAEVEEPDARNAQLEVPRAVRNVPTRNGAAPKVQPPYSPRDAPLATSDKPSAFGRVQTHRQTPLRESDEQQRRYLPIEPPIPVSIMKHQRERVVDRANELETSGQSVLSLPHVDRDERRVRAVEARLIADENLSLVFDGENTDEEDEDEEEEGEEEEAALWLGPSRDRFADRPRGGRGQNPLALQGLPPVGRNRSLGGGAQQLADMSVVSTVGSSEALSTDGVGRQRSLQPKSSGEERPKAETVSNETRSSQLDSLKLLKQVLSLDSSAGEAPRSRSGTAAQADPGRQPGTALFIVNRAMLERAGGQDAVLDALDLASAFENDLNFNVRIRLDKSAQDICSLLRAEKKAVAAGDETCSKGQKETLTSEQTPLSVVVLVTTGRSGDPLGACGRPIPISTLLNELKNGLPANNAGATLLLVMSFEATDATSGTPSLFH